MPGLLTSLIFIPLVGAIVLLLAGKGRDEFSRVFALGVSLLNFVLSIPLFTQFRSDTHEMQFQEHANWIKSLGASYSLGIDGVSVFLVLITTLLTALAILASWKAITSRVREYMAAMLLLETGMLGVFCSLDLFLFYVFWEAMLIPMYLLIGVWGGERRIYAAIKFVLFTLAGSLLMLVAIIYLYYLHGDATGDYTFSLMKLYGFAVARDAQYWLFLAFFLSFAIKVPLFPFHTWLPDAHVEAPTAGSVILAGVLLKMGTYGLIRFCLPLFPLASLYFTPHIMVLSVIGIIYGALVAMVQPDIKKLVAYSSVSHLGFVVLGIFALNAQGMQGGVIQMVNHGISTGALFLIVGMIYERRHTRLIEDFGGLAKVVPVFATFFMITTLSSIGLPGLNGFVGEFLILLGAFKANTVFGVVAATGVVLAAVYMLWMFQRVVWGEVTHEENRSLTDLSVREWVVMVPLVLLMFWIGVYPGSILNKTEASVKHVISQVQARQIEGSTNAYAAAGTEVPGKANR
ncbi:MAG: NADH-quinone oxidoreductase subunit M [Gemmatimonadetes bacterium]|nr:NADH-quinone oxidoreductase subunit M [Gemmatimonadota bacterium]